ncbi:hypothetical protein ACIP4U_09615 [Streptomyces caelestis]|uniref:hypothetical protein n=1 Tax=Streptomyces caelestis TaxID=36816 RepID=UPI00382E3737
MPNSSGDDKELVMGRDVLKRYMPLWVRRLGRSLRKWSGLISDFRTVHNIPH